MCVVHHTATNVQNVILHERAKKMDLIDNCSLCGFGVSEQVEDEICQEPRRRWGLGADRLLPD